MPGIDGWELQRLAVASFPSLHISVITAHQDDVSRQRAIDLGHLRLFTSHLTEKNPWKPFDAAIKQSPKESNPL
jgi:CheY-like chemotaxis protein